MASCTIAVNECSSHFIGALLTLALQEMERLGGPKAVVCKYYAGHDFIQDQHMLKILDLLLEPYPEQRGSMDMIIRKVLQHPCMVGLQRVLTARAYINSPTRVTSIYKRLVIRALLFK